jgi:hypothetical protein
MTQVRAIGLGVTGYLLLLLLLLLWPLLVLKLCDSSCWWDYVGKGLAWCSQLALEQFDIFWRAGQGLSSTDCTYCWYLVLEVCF